MKGPLDEGKDTGGAIGFLQGVFPMSLTHRKRRKWGEVLECQRTRLRLWGEDRVPLSEDME